MFVSLCVTAAHNHCVDRSRHQSLSNLQSVCWEAQPEQSIQIYFMYVYLLLTPSEFVPKIIRHSSEPPSVCISTDVQAQWEMTLFLLNWEVSGGLWPKLLVCKQLADGSLCVFWLCCHGNHSPNSIFPLLKVTVHECKPTPRGPQWAGALLTAVWTLIMDLEPRRLSATS